MSKDNWADRPPEEGVDFNDNIGGLYDTDQPLGIDRTRGAGDYALLMECAPFEEPDSSTESLLPLRETLNNAIGQLKDKERWVFDAITVERCSFLEVATQLNIAKTTAWDIYQRACGKLRDILGDDFLEEHT